ncbi:MAG: ligase-associated DNA damage response endonuclease PdeM [Chitinophagaceae bacterium]|nr:ligase-associated DNA damage response endonuclease PdeM [Chitinophagaceae bacterium]
MQTPISYAQNGQNLWLSPDRSIYWEDKRALILSDLHFGKTGHFRKAGIAVPQGVYKEDLQRLVQLLQYFQPESLIVVGDLFHSTANLELELFRKWRSDFSNLSIQLVKGNHDILNPTWYSDTNLTLHSHRLDLHPFGFTHDITGVQQFDQCYTFSGHIHPGIRVHGGGRQSLSFPCFYFGHDFAVLPAFSRFTGTYLIQPKQQETVFAIIENKIVRLQ